ncbi:hypothetical protein NQZ68_034127 [Dissostichus eleginoides]|nr:hypothetical protein NQZ68_034127 [Dissostichus eleginoides]
MFSVSGSAAGEDQVRISVLEEEMIVAVQEVRGQKEQCFLSTLRSEPTRCDPRLRRVAADVETLNEASRLRPFIVTAEIAASLQRVAFTPNTWSGSL